ncbi:MAG TPA: NAD(P)H-dependent oxidoreductase [Croceibacterium sp.]|nr:NAD(P)H-dependent oxidoreductase [Croceibacterium sp.]
MTILHIDSSITGENSVSRVISRSIFDQLRGRDPTGKVIYRDLTAEPLPHLTLDAMADTAVVDEFIAADAVVIGAPMYNFSLPTQLKAWIDRILVAGKTFSYTEDGPVGLVPGKRVIIALARGGHYNDTAMAALEHLETYLRAVFGFIGIVPEFIAADGINLGPEHRQNAVRGALGQTERLAA